MRMWTSASLLGATASCAIAVVASARMAITGTIELRSRRLLKTIDITIQLPLSGLLSWIIGLARLSGRSIPPAPEPTQETGAGLISSRGPVHRFGPRRPDAAFSRPPLYRDGARSRPNKALKFGQRSMR